MQTNLTPEFASTSRGQHAESILRKCVHCGFCNATCPTYQLLGDELDGPRGRIYQIKLVLEGAPPTKETQRHLDRCLTCRSCETTCPSGVRYSELLEIGREIIEENVPRDRQDRWLRKALTTVIPNPTLFKTLMSLGRLVRPMLPGSIKSKVPPKAPDTAVTSISSPPLDRKMVMLRGCAQPTLTPNTNIMAKNVLQKLGIEAIELEAEGCCGAVSAHTSNSSQGREAAKTLIDLWLSHIDQGVEGFIVTASGCGVMVKDYPVLFRDDPIYLEKAKKISEKTFDLSEIVLEAMKQTGLRNKPDTSAGKVAFHAPCTLQHGQKIKGQVENILSLRGYEVCQIRNGHLCCGSAGTYSILQEPIAVQLRENKWNSLVEESPDLICTANVGCQTWLNGHKKANKNPEVKHWIELV